MVPSAAPGHDKSPVKTEGKGKWDVGISHEEGVTHPSFVLPEEKTSGQGLELQERQFWLKD